MAAGFKACKVPGCNGNAHYSAHGVGGYCNPHQLRLKRHGDVVGGGQFREMTPYPCAVAGCGSRGEVGGYCRMHYARFKRHGNPLGGGTSHWEPLEWLQEHLSYAGDDCLIWPFAREQSGYGRLTAVVDGPQVGAHREMCRLVHGEPPTPSHETAHLCGKGHEGCVNPRHLAWKTQTENAADKLVHNTHIRGTRHPLNRLTEAQVRRIRALEGLLSQQKLADQYGVSRQTIQHIHRRTAWAWLV